MWRTSWRLRKERDNAAARAAVLWVSGKEGRQHVVMEFYFRDATAAT